MLALGITARFRYFVCLRAVYPALIGEEQQPAMGGRYKKVLDHIVSSQLGTFDTFASAMLAAIVIATSSFDIAASRDAHDHFFFGDEVLIRHLTGKAHHDFGASVIAKAGSNLAQFLRNDGALTFFARQYRLEVRNHRLKLGRLIDNFLALQGRKSAQLEIKNRNSLVVINP